MSLLVPPRRPSRELLDDPDFPADQMELYLEDLDLVNRIWRNARMLASHLKRSGGARMGSPWRILDLGAGSGKVASDLSERLNRLGRPATVIAVDLQWRHLAAGRARIRGRANFAAADGFRLPFADGAVDWIVSTLFFHHFSPEENVLLLREVARVAKNGFAIMDIRRHRVPLSLIRTAGRLALGIRASTEDGAASVRQSYTLEEASEIARRAIPGARVKRVFPFRLLLYKSSAPTPSRRALSPAAQLSAAQPRR